MSRKKRNNSKKDPRKKIVVIGGGTGSFVVLSGLKEYPVDLTVIVTVTDSGGSTGRLRTEFGFLPLGDMRQCLAALASNKNNDYIRRLLLYRFAKGKGIYGHNLGNLILTALTDMTGSEAKAVEIAAKIFRLQGKILPITLENIQLVATYEDSQEIRGEHDIDEPKHGGGKKIINLRVEPKASIYPPSTQAIIGADLIVLGPGDLYTSILPNLIIAGTQEAINKTKSKLIYIVNLMTRYSQTHRFTAQNHVKVIENYLGKNLDHVLVNTGRISPKVLKLYEKEKGYPVKNDLSKRSHFQVVKKNFLTDHVFSKPKGDNLKRSYLRHDSQILARTIFDLL